MRRFVILALYCAIIAMWPYYSKAENPITNIHNAIVQEKEWLNVSRPLKAEDLKGRIILLDFWTFCCINCMHVIPDLQYLEKKFDKKLTVIGVHSAKFANEREKENIRSAILRYGIEHPVVNDAAFRIWQGFGVHAWPTLLLISPDGRLEETFSGEGHRSELEEEIEDLITEYEKELNTSPLPIVLESAKVPSSVLRFPGKFEYAAKYDGSPAFFISDSGNNRILGIRPSGEIFLTVGGTAGFRDGDFKEAAFRSPQGLLYKDKVLYVADTNNHSLRRIDLEEKKVSTIAGTGEQGSDRRVSNENALETKLASPWDLAFYPSDRYIAVAMAGTHQLWLYDIKEKTVSVLAGNGREAIDDGRYPFNSLSQPSGLAAYNDKLYFVDSETSSLRVLENGEIRTLIGTGLFDFGFADGEQGKALMQHPLGLFADEKGIIIADSYNHSIRQYNSDSGALSTISGDGTREILNEPNDLLRIQDKLYVLDTNNHAIRVLTDNTFSTLDVMYPVSAPALLSAEELPNLLATKPEVTSTDTTVSIGLPKGWKINRDAPSRLSLFTAEGKHIESYDTPKLFALRIILPKLAPEQSYIIQGTLYYCEDKEGALCLIQSMHQEIMATKGGVKDLTLPLRIADTH